MSLAITFWTPKAETCTSLAGKTALPAKHQRAEKSHDAITRWPQPYTLWCILIPQLITGVYRYMVVGVAIYLEIKVWRGTCGPRIHPIARCRWRMPLSSSPSVGPKRKFHTGGADENRRSSTWDDGRLRSFSVIFDFQESHRPVVLLLVACLMPWGHRRRARRDLCFGLCEDGSREDNDGGGSIKTRVYVLSRNFPLYVLVKNYYPQHVWKSHNGFLCHEVEYHLRCSSFP
jgi:hypothetical protein